MVVLQNLHHQFLTTSTNVIILDCCKMSSVFSSIQHYHIQHLYLQTSVNPCLRQLMTLMQTTIVTLNMHMMSTLMIHVTQLLYPLLLEFNKTLILLLVSNLEYTYMKYCPHIVVLIYHCMMKSLTPSNFIPQSKNLISQLQNCIFEKNLQQLYQTYTNLIR